MGSNSIPYFVDTARQLHQEGVKIGGRRGMGGLKTSGAKSGQKVA
tara:strand:+ start:5156 stop:5290 length:135 start_codon:yes stop_codon:yes gene_type:complete